MRRQLLTQVPAMSLAAALCLTPAVTRADAASGAGASYPLAQPDAAAHAPRASAARTHRTLLAQTEAPTGAGARAQPVSGRDMLKEVIVTAERRAENVERVPLTDLALGSRELMERSIEDPNDLQTAVPGLTVSQGGSSGFINYSIRGQGVDMYTNSPPSVLTYIDEAQISTPLVDQLYDLQNVQVLKGPQGTLFGRNTTGGAILYQTAMPDKTFGGYVSVQYGNFESKLARFAVSLPINSVVALRLAGAYGGGGAYEYNLATGSYMGDQNKKSVRATLVLTPGDGLKNTTVLQQSWQGGQNTPPDLWSAYPCGATYRGRPLVATAACYYTSIDPLFNEYIAAHPNIYQGGVLAFLQYEKAIGPWQTDVNAPFFNQARSTVAIDTTSYEVSPELTLKNIASYNDSWSSDGFDYDGTPYPIFQTGGTPSANATTIVDPQGFFQLDRQISEEIQAQGKILADRLVYTGGFYYMDELLHVHSPLEAFDFSPIAAGLAFDYGAHMYDRSEAGYLQGTYKLTGKLSLTGGVRYTWDQLSAIQDPDSTFAPGNQSMSESDPSWTAGIAYQALPSLMLYVTTRGSWRAGGYNYSVIPINATGATGGDEFLPETTHDVEAGMKYSGNGLGVPFAFNADIYNQWIKDVQNAAYVIGLSGTSTLLTANVPAMEVSGIEAELQLQPLEWLQLGLEESYADARYTNGNVTLLGSTVSYGPVDNTPRWTGSFFAEVTHALRNGAGMLRLRGDAYGQSETPFSSVGNTEAPFTTLPGYGLANFRLSWGGILGSDFTAALYVRNAFDKEYYQGGNPEGPSLGVNYVDPGMPRMYGAEVRWDF